MSHFHYFLESQFGYSNVRDSDFIYCKSLLISELLGSGLLFHLHFGHTLKSFDCNTMQMQVYNVPQLTDLYAEPARVQFWTLDQNTLFISGGKDLNYEMNHCYTFNISTNTVVRNANMNVPRICHGL